MCFFVWNSRDEEWFQLKYHPQSSLDLRKRVLQLLETLYIEKKKKKSKYGEIIWEILSLTFNRYFKQIILVFVQLKFL